MVESIIDKYPKLNNDEKVIGKIIIECFLNKKFQDIFSIVKHLPHIKGDLQLETEDGNINAPLFWIAVIMNNIPLMRTLFDRGCNINALGTYKDMFKREGAVTPLYAACAFRLEEVIKLLLTDEYKADVNITATVTGYTPLMVVTARYSKQEPFAAIDIANDLLRRGADINFISSGGKNTTALDLAADGNGVYARYLIHRGAV